MSPPAPGFGRRGQRGTWAHWDPCVWVSSRRHRSMMMSIFSDRYYGPTPYSTTFVRHSSDRTPTVVRYDDPDQAPPPLPHCTPGPPGTLGGRDCGHRLSQPRYRRARAQALSTGRDRGPAAPHSARAGAYRDASVASRTPAGDRPRPTYSGCRSAHWPTSLLATSLAGKTQGAVTAETVRLSLHAAGGVCQRPTWTLKRKAEAQPGSVGNASG